MAACVSHPHGIIESSRNQTKKKSRLPTKPPKKSHVEFPSPIKVSESCVDNCIINGLIPGPSWFETRYVSLSGMEIVGL